MSVGWVFLKKMEGSVVFVDLFWVWLDYYDGLWCYLVGVCGENFIIFDCSLSKLCFRIDIVKLCIGIGFERWRK